MAEKKYTENLGLTKQDETDFVDGPEISRSFSVLDEVIGKLGDLTTEEKRSLIGAINQINSDLLEKVYPVGSIYISVNNTNPGNIFGGTWERFANGRTLVGVDENDPDFNIVGKSGGSKNVALNIKQIPTHSHQESDYTYVYTEEHPANNSIVTTNQNGRQNINANIKSKTYTKNAGGGEAHSNLQPYIAIFYWIRRK